MACDAAIREVRKRAAHIRLEIITPGRFHAVARRIFRSINWWTLETIEEALAEVTRERTNGQNERSGPFL